MQYWWVNDRFFCYDNLLHFGYEDGKMAEQQNLTSMNKGDLFIKYRASSNKNMWHEEYKKIPKQSIYAVGIVTSNEIINKREDGFEREVENQFLDKPLAIDQNIFRGITDIEEDDNSNRIVQTRKDTGQLSVQNFFVRKISKKVFEYILEKIKLENPDIKENKWNYSPKKEENKEAINKKDDILGEQNVSTEVYEKNLRLNRRDEKYERDNTKFNDACRLHEKIHTSLYNDLKINGFNIIRRFKYPDLFAEKNGIYYLFEIKSLFDDESPRNQFKIGLGQLLLYDYALTKEKGLEGIKIFLVIPKTTHDLEFYRNLYMSKNIRIIVYPDELESILI